MWSIGLLCDFRQFWIGFSWSSQARKLIIMPLPCIGFVIDFNERDPSFGRDY